MNDSLISSSIRRGRIRSRLLGAVMAKGRCHPERSEGSAFFGFLRGNTSPKDTQNRAARQRKGRHLSSAPTVVSGASDRLRRLRRRPPRFAVVVIVHIVKFARIRIHFGVRRALARQRFGPLALVPLIPLARDLTRQLAVPEPERERQ